MKIYTLQCTLSFGKYQGQTIEQVMATNPKYLAWCLGNLRTFVLDEQALRMLCTHCPLEAALYICQNLSKKAESGRIYPTLGK